MSGGSPAASGPGGSAAPAPASSVAGLGATLLASTMFSWGFVIVKYLPLEPATLASYRLAIGASVYLLVARLMKVPRPVGWGNVLGAGLFFGLHQLLYISATQATSIAIVTLIGALQPLIVALVSHRTVGERPPPSLPLFALLAASGVALVVWANADDPSRSLLGDALAVVNVAAYTGYFLMSKRARAEGTHTLTLTTAAMGGALLVVAPALVFSTQRVPGEGLEWGLVALLALGPGSGHLLVNWAHRRASAALTSLVLTAVPLLASVWAHLVFDEPYGWPHMVGIALVALAVEGGRRAELTRLRRAIPSPDASAE